MTCDVVLTLGPHGIHVLSEQPKSRVDSSEDNALNVSYLARRTRLLLPKYLGACVLVILQLLDPVEVLVLVLADWTLNDFNYGLFSANSTVLPIAHLVLALEWLAITVLDVGVMQVHQLCIRPEVEYLQLTLVFRDSH